MAYYSSTQEHSIVLYIYRLMSIQCMILHYVFTHNLYDFTPFVQYILILIYFALFITLTL